MTEVRTVSALRISEIGDQSRKKLSVLGNDMLHMWDKT